MNIRRHIATHGVRAAWQARTEPESLPMLARTYWRIVMALAVVITIALLAYAGYFLLGLLASLEPGTPPPLHRDQMINKTQLNAINDVFSQQQILFASHSMPIPIPADPSL